jgi:tripartite-type tricarboxylate transporter receptor subunit TctC
MVTRRVVLAALLILAGSVLTGAFVEAADPQFTKPVRIIVPYAPGGSSDILARLMGPYLSKAIGQPVVVENKTGASGNIGADFVAKAEKDGHTMLITDVGTLAAAPSLFSKLTFDVEKDLAPVAMVMFASYILGTHPSLPVNTVAELVANAKANPGKLALAHSGVGSVGHLTGYVLAKHWGIDWKYVPYKGGAAAIRAVVANESNVIINGALATQPFVTQNQIKGIAVSGTKRLNALKDVPTFKELNLPAVESGTWQGILTTGGTPAPMVARLNAELKKVLAMPEVQQKIEAQGGEVRIGSPEDFSAWMKANIASWGAVVREANIKVE